MSRITRQPDIPALTGLRFWAAFFILLNHLLLGFVSRENPWLKNLLGAGATLGMSTFFILSGFIIHYNYHEKLQDFSLHSFYEFFVARFSRLYPLFIFLFLVDFFATNLTIQRFNPDDVWRALKYFFVMGQSWFYLPTTTGETITYMFPRASITWSISAEMLMYSSYPLLLLLFLRDRLGNLKRILLCVGTVFMLSVGLSLTNTHMDVIDSLGVSIFGEAASVQRNASYSFAFWLLYLSPYVRVFEFIIGAVTAHLLLKLRKHKVSKSEWIVMNSLGLLSLFFIVGTFLPDQFSISWIRRTIGFVGYYPCITIIMFIAARYTRSFLCKIFSNATFVNLGERSYSIYLFHIFVYASASHPSDLGLVSIGVQIAVLWITVFACAYILYSYIEMPARVKVRNALMNAYPSISHGWKRMFS